MILIGTSLHYELIIGSSLQFSSFNDLKRGKTNMLRQILPQDDRSHEYVTVYEPAFYHRNSFEANFYKATWSRINLLSFLKLMKQKR